MSNKIYSVSSVDNFISSMIQKGYEAIQVNEGILGVGDWILLSHNESKYNFIIREVFVNDWTSGQTIRRTAKISKALQTEIDNVLCMSV